MDLFLHVIKRYSLSTCSTPLMKYWLFDSSKIWAFKPCIDRVKNAGAFSLGGCRESHVCHSYADQGKQINRPFQHRSGKREIRDTPQARTLLHF
jgi:hypothetical protein